MSKVICIMGESGSGKTTSMRNLDPNCYNNGQLADMYIYSRVKIGE